MKKAIAILMPIVCCVLLPLIVIAQVVTEPTGNLDALSDVVKLVNALGSQNWLYAASLAIVLLVYAIKKYALPGVNTAWLPVISSGLGVGVAVAANLAQATPLALIPTVLGGLFMGTAASGFWSLVVKHLIDLVTKKKDDTVKQESK
jgi:hypothetical protein